MKKNDWQTHDTPRIIENRANYEGFIMYDGLVAIGFILYNNIGKKMRTVDNMIISFMLIDKKYRNMGCGTQLYKTFEASLKNRDDLLITVQYNKLENNAEFWRKNDFKKKWRGMKNTSSSNNEIIKIYNAIEKEKTGVITGMAYLYKILKN
jgi:predicted acetyltransferase